MSVIFALLFVAIAFGVGYWLQRRRAGVAPERVVQAKLPSVLEKFFAHPGHAWLEVVEPELVSVGSDRFTVSVFGSVEEVTIPEPGTVLRQGGKAWKLKRGTRQLHQASPISGKVVEINQDLKQNPRLLEQKDTEKNWILKVRPLRIKMELQNLLHGNVLRRWNQAVKEQLVATLTTAEFPVLQEGGEIKPDLGDELTPEQWERVSREFFK
jgi:glycine cleavage system H protein